MAEVKEMSVRRKEEKNSSTVREDREIIKTSWSSNGKVRSGEYILCRPSKKPGGEETDEVDATTTMSRASVTTLEYTTQTSTNSLKTVKTAKAAPATISAASSTWEEHVQTGSNRYGNNKVPSIVRMEPMNNATQGSKKNEPETLL